MPVVNINLPVPRHQLRRLHGLNERHEVELSSLSLERLDVLFGNAFVAATIDDGDALLLAFDEMSDYDSPNFLWFRERFERFAYVDRVVVSESRRGEGLARHLYEHLFALAAAAGHERVVCEVNFDPPNPASDAFHDRLGFVEVGRTVLSNGKGVRYLETTQLGI